MRRTRLDSGPLPSWSGNGSGTKSDPVGLVSTSRLPPGRAGLGSSVAERPDRGIRPNREAAGSSPAPCTDIIDGRLVCEGWTDQAAIRLLLRSIHQGYIVMPNDL